MTGPAASRCSAGQVTPRRSTGVNLPPRAARWLLPAQLSCRWRVDSRVLVASSNSVAYGHKLAKVVYSAGRDLELRRWSADDGQLGEPTAVLTDHHTLTISSLALSPDERMLASGARDTSVRLWDVATASTASGSGGNPSLTASAAIPRNLVTCMQVGDAQRTACTLPDIVVPPLSFPRPLHPSSCRRPPGHDPFQRTQTAADKSTPWPWLQWLPECCAEPTIVQGSEDLRIRCWDSRMMSKFGTNLKAITQTFAGFSNIPLCIDVEPGDGWMVASGHKGFNGVGCELRLWDRRNPAVPMSVLQGHEQTINSCAFVPGDDGAVLVVSGSNDRTVCVWSVATGDCLQSLHFGSNVQAVTTLSNIRPHVAVGCFDGDVHVHALAADSQLELVHKTAKS